MAIKALMLRKKISDKKKLLEELRAKDAEFEKREQELAASIEEANTEEEQAAVEETANAFDSEKQEHEEAKANLEAEISGLEEELKDAEKNETPKNEERKDKKEMNIRTRKFFGMTMEQRDAFVAREDVHDFLTRMREIAGQKRAVAGAEATIPVVVMDLLREMLPETSKLYKHVYVKKVAGKARQPIMGVIPEAVWTEATAGVNEIDLDIGKIEVDGYKVAAFIPVSNSLLEDTDAELAEAVIEALGKAIGKAVDKAIVYGTGVKMPTGIVTALCADETLAASNVLAISGKTDTALFKELVTACGNAKSRCSNGVKFWVMSEKTHAELTANALSINAAGAVVSGVEKTMPVITGAIEVLDFMPDGVIAGGYGDLYTLAERSGSTVGQSEHAQYIEDNTVFKATARYDGKPAIPAGFVAIGIKGTKPTANAVTFAAAKAGE